MIINKVEIDLAPVTNALPENIYCQLPKQSIKFQWSLWVDRTT